ncbi:hypothetical protein [Siminovitchia fordii]|uniref:Uncharacterized protein n=1 Tax=Siminovitchia fordii TaxID=254759 RepID=A0ABQ4KBS2_9BACI|nr:hypothetical protein [Siminovitchia fordii]GIN22535.1 hypothetical protein J1TS3_36690 [Siminovitchia fordii]
MKEIKYQTVTETREKEVGYIKTCNKCGKKKNVNHEKNEEWRDDFKEFYLDFGYESSFDGESWNFDLCEECLINFIKQFKHVPNGFKNGNYSFIKNREEHQKVFESWLETGIWDELEFKTYEEISELNTGWTNIDYLNEAIKQYHPGRPLLDKK